MSDSEATTNSRPSSSNSTQKRTKRGKKKLLKKTNPAPYVHMSTVYESHKSTIYGCAFNPYSEVPYFATVGGNRVTIYEVPNDKPSVKALRCYADPNKQEAFFSVCWAYDTDSNTHAVVAGGHLGSIRVIDSDSMKVITNLIGHGEAVNDVRTCPQDSEIIASASKDFTARIWHIRNSSCLAILGGVEGHMDQVLSVDFNVDSTYLVSASMDHTVKLWHIGEGSGVQEIIEQANSELKKIDNPKEVHYAHATTRDIHTNYVDCVRLVGTMVFSKSTEDELCMWKWGSLLEEGIAGQGSLVKTETSIHLIRTFDMPKTSMWFTKFEMDPAEKYFVCGNQKGEIRIWDFRTSGKLPNERRDFVLKDVWHTVRQCTFSTDGKHMIAVGDDWCVIRYDRNDDFK